MDVADIKDQESLKTWLESWPTGTEAEEDHARKVAVQIAHRAAMRVLPSAWAWAVESGDRDMTGFAIFRCSVIAGVAGKCPPPAIRLAAPYAYAAAAVYVDARGDAYAAAAAAAAFADARAAAAARAAARAAATYADIWPYIRQDAATLRDGGDAMDLPLWHDDAPPLAKDWQKIKDHYGNDPQWKFWIDWYENALQGRPQNWDMLTEIALIDSKTWEQGPDTVNPVIMGIVEEYDLDAAIARNPYALKVTLNSRRNRLLCEPTEQVNLEDVVKSLRQSMNDLIRRCKSGGSGNNFGEELFYHAHPVVQELRKSVNKHKNNPLLLFNAIESAAGELHDRLEGAGLNQEVLTNRFLSELDRHKADICLASPDTLATVKARRGLELTFFTDQRIEHYIRMCRGMEDASQGYLRIMCIKAIATVNDPTAPEIERENAWVFMRAMIPRGARTIYREALPVIEGHEDAVSLRRRIIQWADDIAKLDKAGESLQDAASEIPWVELMDLI